jgi:hypothetical protein
MSTSLAEVPLPPPAAADDAPAPDAAKAPEPCVLPAEGPDVNPVAPI